MIFYWCTSDSCLLRSPGLQASLFSTMSLDGLDISSNFTTSYKAFGTVSIAPIIINITVTIMFHIFLKRFLAKSKNISLFVFFALHCGPSFSCVFCLMHIPFSSMIKFQFLAKFPLDHLPHSVMSTFDFFKADLLRSLIISSFVFVKT